MDLPTRRRFLAVVPVGFAAAGFASSAQDAVMLPVIDTHQHLWDLTRFALPWVKPGDALHAQHTNAEYAVAAHGCNIVKAVYMEVGMASADQQREAEHLIDICKSGQHVTCAAVVAGNPAGAGFAKYVQQFKDSKSIKGIRHMLHVDGVHAADGLKPEFLKGLHLLGELGLRFDLCIRPAELPDIVKIVEACPDTKFVLDHCGNPQANFNATQIGDWKKGLAALAARKNVMCKVSGIVANGFVKDKWTADDLAPFVNTVLDTFGPDRVMYASDWPVCTRTATFKQWFDALKTIVSPRPAAEQRKLFHDNAEAFYGLKA